MKPLPAKEQIREELLERRRSLGPDQVRAASQSIEKRFMGSGLFRGSARLALYASFSNEVSTDEILACALRCGKEVCYPRVVREGGAHLSFYRVDSPDVLVPGAYGLKEPDQGAGRVDPEGLDLVVVPGVAFDTTGARLGFGKGYYDRALAGLECPVIALAYDFQVLEGEKIPVEPHDVRVAAIVTERRVIEAGSGAGRVLSL